MRTGLDPAEEIQDAGDRGKNDHDKHHAKEHIFKAFFGHGRSIA